MSMETDFLLGLAFGLLSRVRQHLVINNDSSGVLIIEDEYQELKKGLDKLYYGEKNDG